MEGIVMTDIHSCSYYCERPECIKAQRDELRDRLAQPNDFNPNWDAMAVMVEEQQRMAKRIAELEAQPEHKPMHPTLQKMWEGYFDKCYKREPEQEPVEHTTGHCENHKQKGGCQLHNLQCGWPDCDRKPITNQPQSKPLTDNELADLWYKQSTDWMEFARAIEAAHGIKGDA